MNSLLILIVISFITGTYCFTLKSSNNNIADKIWNNCNNDSIESDIKTLINGYTKRNRKFITGCFESKPIITNGVVPEWKKYSDFITKFTNNNSNRNYQIFKSNSNAFYNLSEYNGAKFFATASGEISGSDDKFIANVNEIAIYVLLFQKFRKFKFSVNGTGIINIIFQSDEYRIVQNENAAIAFQKKVPIPNVYKEILDIE